MALEYDASFVESEKKSKKRKHDKQDNKHFSDAVNIKKKQKKSEIHQDVGDGGVCKEALDTTLNPVHREEKKKNRKKTASFLLPKKLIRGKRFTPEENEMVKEAVNNYIIDHNLGENGMDMIMHSRKHRKLRNCWKEIGLALPHRHYQAVYKRAHIIFEGSADNKWSEEEFDQLRKLHAEHGPKWKLLEEITGRYSRHIEHTWARLKLLNRKSGSWSQDEYQKLFDLVNMDLKLKLFTDKKSKHGMLRDNIGWTAIGETLGTRATPACCYKWYHQLSSPMVRAGVWADKDDYLLLGILFNLDACSVEEVNWDSLIEGRTGEVCRRRWNQMVCHIGHYKTKSFPEQVEILLQRYKLDLIEARQIWDNKPYVP